MEGVDCALTCNSQKREIMKYSWLFIVFILTFSLNASETSLKDIKNYRQLSDRLSSAGLPDKGQIKDLQKAGFQHVINLIPGDYSAEQSQVKATGMSFNQIEVDWHNPTLENFKTFAGLLDQYSDGKTLVHCQLNYRATAFVYLYQLIKDQDTSLAEEQMQSIWQGDENWDDFISLVKKTYSK